MKHSASDSFMSKNHMRNLRAKVKQLIAPDLCRCSLHRHDRVDQLEFKKRIWKTKQSKKGRYWNYPALSREPYYNDDQCQLQTKPEFQKLTKGEIQQVAEFKHYYLGDKNIESFQEYLEGKDSKKSTPRINLDSGKRGYDSVKETRESRNKHQSQYELNRSLSKYPSNYRQSNHEEYVHKQSLKRFQARSNYESLLQKQERINLESIDRSETRIIAANRTKQDLINKYVSQLQAKDLKHKLERLKIQEKRNKEVENIQILGLASKLKKMCSFKPQTKAQSYHYRF